MFGSVIYLGSGGSGKSTFIKQLKIVYDNGYTERERMEFRPIIFQNIYENICKIVLAVDREGLQFDGEDAKVNKNAFSKQLSSLTQNICFLTILFGIVLSNQYIVLRPLNQYL